ncbi:MAG: beta-ribofuranosylaminobenzene 5'-phosphate synthase family protein, partial [Acetobacteraceae bacterium]
ALDGPETRITLRRSAATVVTGTESERAARYIEVATRVLAPGSHHELNVMSAAPAHSGLGSGTQLALAVASAVRQLHGLPQDPDADARMLGRGGRSGIGVASFRQGGFMVDGGRGGGKPPPPLLIRMTVPATWRIILVHDRNYRGLAGRDETNAFAALPPFGAERAAKVSHLLLMGALPALVEEDLDRFGMAITRIQELLGRYFAPVQGGRFASPRVAAALEVLAAAGATGLGQSSWGPTGFGFARDAASAEFMIGACRRSGEADGVDIEMRRARNRGALVTEVE